MDASSGKQKRKSNSHRSTVLPKLFQPINEALKPFIQLGFANPLVLSPGATVLEVAGRKSGKALSVPLTCYWTGFLLIIGTVRPGSQWIRNLAVDDKPHVWLWGRRWRVTKLSVTNHVAILSLNWRSASDV